MRSYKNFLATFLFISCHLFAAEAADKTPADKSAEAAKPLTLAELTKSSQYFPGLLGAYQNKSTGALYLKIQPQQLNQQFIHYAVVSDGLPEAFDQFRGNYWDPKIYSFQRRFNKVDVRVEQTGLYIDPKNPLSRAAQADVNRAVLASVAIELEDKKTGDLYIKADDIFLKEALRQIKPSPNPEAKPGEQFPLGILSADKTQYRSVHNYPMNTDVVVEYVFENPTPFRKSLVGFNTKDLAMSDDRNISVIVRHSLVSVPKNDYQPRRDDPRVGYFTQIVQDMASYSATPYRDVINRWHLKKKDPDAALSEPVEPIVFWLENTTPLEFRETIKTATLNWNKAFEKAGFKNAIRVEQQPDDATWDAGDLRYNVLRWQAAPNPQFGGYGPSFADPRSGQILGADIMLEFVYVSNQSFYSDIYSDQLRTSNRQQQRWQHEDLVSRQAKLQLATSVAALEGASDEQIQTIRLQALFELVLHEVGHTLGLSHNMKASQMLNRDEINDKTITRRVGLSASVMDYPSANIAPLNKPQGDYFTLTVGPYDLWAIEYAYSTALSDPVSEQNRLNEILARSTEPALAFGNDADDMRTVGFGIDPRVMIYDMSSDAIGYAADRIIRVQSVLPQLLQKKVHDGNSYQSLVRSYRYMMLEIRDSSAAISRYIGGVYVSRAFKGQPGESKPFIPTPLHEQKRAMNALNKLIFAPSAFEVSGELYAYLQTQRRAWYFSEQTEDPKIHDRIAEVQNGVLDQLLSSVVHKRLLDSALYGNQYQLVDMMTDVSDAIFADDARGSVNSVRRRLQKEYVSRLSGLLQSNDDSSASNRDVYRHQLNRIEEMLSSKNGDNATKVHREYLRAMIRQTLQGFPLLQAPAKTG